MFSKVGKNNKKDEKVEIPSREVKQDNKKIDTSANTSSKVSIISNGLKVKGEISGNSDIDVYGEVEGNINLENNNLNIETTAQIKADVVAKTVRVNGKITGNISAIEKILVTSNGSVIGGMSAPKVELQDGANFDGNISMKKNSKK